MIRNVFMCLAEMFRKWGVGYPFPSPLTPNPNHIPHTEPKFVNHLRSQGIDSQPARPVRQPFLTYRPAGLHKLADFWAPSTFTNSGSGLCNWHSNIFPSSYLTEEFLYSLLDPYLIYNFENDEMIDEMIPVLNVDESSLKMK